MRATHKAIEHPRVVIVGVFLALALAVLATISIPVQRTPAINTAVVLVTVPYPGAQPAEVEEQITRKIENALQRLKDVDKIQSMSMRGSSVISVIFLDGVPGPQARAEVEHLVNEVRRELPAGREVQPIITVIDFESAPLMLVNLGGPEGFDERALKQIARDVQDELEAIPGVSNSQLFGGREREFHVNLDPDLMAAYGLSIDQVRQAILEDHAELPGGALNTGHFDFQVRNETKFRGVEDIREVVVAERQGRLLRVADVADVRDTYRRLQNIAHLDGRETATIIVNKEANINTLAAARQLQERVEQLRLQYPHIDFAVTRDITTDIRFMFSSLGTSALQGGIVVLLVLAWAMGLRISFLVLMAIPFSTALGLIFLYAAATPISNLVIFSFILILGMVVDGAIIVAENIHRHLEMGEPPVEAAKRGIDEVGIPVIAADLTTVSAFLPMLLVPGIMGDFMGVMPKVVSVALLGSVLVDHFLIPVLAAYWYRQKPVPRETTEAGRSAEAPAASGPRWRDYNPLRPHHGPVTRLYSHLLRWALGHRWAVVATALLAFVWAALMLPHIGREFFPQSDRGQFEINFELPLGYSIEETLRASTVFTGPLLEMQQQGDVVHFVTAIGSSAGLASRLESDPATGPEFGKIMVELEPANERNRKQSEIVEELRSRIRPWPGMTYRIYEPSEGPPGGADVAVRLTGHNLAQLGTMGEKVAARLEEVRGTRDVATDYRPDSPELVVEPDVRVVGLFDTTSAQIARAVQTAILGDTSIRLSFDEEDVNIRLQVDPQRQRSGDDIRHLMWTTPSGRRVAVGQVADIRRDAGLYAVNRYERRRAVTVRCDLVREENVRTDDVFAILRADILPELGFDPVSGNHMELVGSPGTAAEGIRATFTGVSEEMEKNFGYLTRVMIVAVILIFTILTIQFNSFRQTMMVLATVPLSFVGVMFGLWVSGQPFSMASFIGLVALTGIVVNDAIVLVAFTNTARRRGLGVRQALLDAGVQRMRPVFLTSATTIGGLMPLYLNLAGGGEFWQPLAGAIIFGLAFATVLTLVVVPVAYSLLYFNRFRQPSAESP